MGGAKKSTPPQAPAPPNFQGSNVMEGDFLRSRTTKKGDDVITQSFLTPFEQQMQAQAQAQIAQLMPQLTRTSQQTDARARELQDAYRNQSMMQFNQQWNPMVADLQENNFSKFGANTNQPFVDAMRKALESVASPAMQSIGNQAVMMREDLLDRDTQRKAQQLQMLGVPLSENQARLLSGLGSTQAGATMGQNFANQQFSNQFNAQQYNQANQPQRGRSIWDKVANPFGM
jgi:hypothetical protein